MENIDHLGLYVTLAMKNLYFLNVQIDNVVSEVQRLAKHLRVEEISAQLHK